MNYESTFTIESTVLPGVTLTVLRVSIARRLELLKKVRELTARVEFYKAGAQLEDKLDASIASAEVESLYVLWGVSRVHGLTIDGAEATPESLVNHGPQSLVREAASVVRSQLGLSEEEIKN